MRNLRVFPRVEKKHFKQIEQIDSRRFGGNVNPEFFALAQKHPELYTVLCHNNDVAGYGLVVPVSHFAVEAIKRGEMGEDEILKHVEVRKPEADYIASIASDPTAGAILRSRLVGYTLGPLLRSPREAIAVAVSEDGDSIAKEIGLKPIGENKTFIGLDGYSPKLFIKPAFEWS